jgi:predicted nucleotidyltransferase
VSEVAARTARGSEIGVRRSLARLVEQGIVRTTEVGRTRVYELNRDHVAAQIAVLLSGLRPELWKRLREAISKWGVRPVYACAFGSAARGDGGPDSDIDLLLVHPPFPGEERPKRGPGLLDTLESLALGMAMPPTTEADVARWYKQIDELHALVQKWTGNMLQVVDLSAAEWADRKRVTAAFFKEIDRDAIVLLAALPMAAAAAGGSPRRT